jgi:GNAT superfamily N-acetyltransferase
MSNPQDILALERRLEANEIAAWRAMCRPPAPAIAAQLGLGYAEQGGALLIWNRAAPTLLFNRILALGVFEPADDALIDALLARAHAEKSRCMIQLAPGVQPADLAARLQARGLRAQPAWLMHSRALDDNLPETVVPAGYRIEQVAPAEAAAWGDALLAAWGFPAAAAAGALALALTLIQHPDATCFAAIEQSSGLVVGGGALVVSGDVGGLYSDGVRVAHRRHGIQEALIVARLAEARRRGCALACSQTLEAHSSQHNMALAGFEIAYKRQNFVTPK